MQKKLVTSDFNERIDNVLRAGKTRLTSFSGDYQFTCNNFSDKMASKEEIPSLEHVLESNLPPKELDEVKRILYGRQLK